MTSYILSDDNVNEITKYINTYRIKHNSPELIYDKELSIIAQKHAIAMLKKKELNYDDTEYSQVLYCSWACRNQKMQNILKGIDECYKESNLYNYDEYSISNAKKCKNFTALIWKNSTKLGIGYAYVNAKCVLCLYIMEKGNKPELYAENVLSVNDSKLS